MAMNSFLVRCSYVITHPKSSKNAVNCVLLHLQSSSLIRSTIGLMWKDKTAIQYSLLVSLLFPKLSVTFLKSTSLQILQRHGVHLPWSFDTWEFSRLNKLIGQRCFITAASLNSREKEGQANKLHPCHFLLKSWNSESCEVKDCRNKEALMQKYSLGLNYLPLSHQREIKMLFWSVVDLGQLHIRYHLELQCNIRIAVPGQVHILHPPAFDQILRALRMLFQG